MNVNGICKLACHTEPKCECVFIKILMPNFGINRVILSAQMLKCCFKL